MSALAKAELLIQQSKYDQAEKEIKVHLADNPNDGLSHSALALAYLGQAKQNEALESAQRGVGLMPDLAYPFYILSRCYLNLDDVNNAFDASTQTLNLDPEDEDYLCNHAIILSNLKKNEEALETLGKALAINPEHADSKKIKSIVLRELGRYAEADEIAGDALSDAPESASAFAAKGWSALDAGKTKESLELFKSAVMLDPNSEFAKSGMVMAIKAQNKLFHLFYMFYNWVARLSPKMRWGLVIGIVVFAQFIRKSSTSSSELAPLFQLVFALYLCFVFLTWNINNIFNIFLRFNRYGKHALDKGETLASNLMAGILISAMVLYGATFVIENFSAMGAVGALFLTLVLSGTFRRWDTPQFKYHATFAVFITACWMATVFLPLFGKSAGSFESIFLIGVIGYSWVSSMVK